MINPSEVGKSGEMVRLRTLESIWIQGKLRMWGRWSYIGGGSGGNMFNQLLASGKITKTAINEALRRMKIAGITKLNRPGFPGECFICELRLPDHRFRWKHNKLFLLLPVGYGPAFPAIVDCYTSPPT